MRYRTSSPQTIITVLFFAALLIVGLEPLPISAAIFTVTTESDDNGLCEPNDCALREAILAANESPGMNTILLPAGHYQLTLPKIDDDALRTGSLDIRGEMELKGEDPRTTVIAGDGLDRVFLILDSVVEMSNLTIRGGRTTGSGGGLRIGNSDIDFRNCVIRDNESTQVDGGGIFAFESVVMIEDSAILDNTAYGDGGGIFRFGVFPHVTSDMTLINTTVSGNSAFQGGGLGTTSEGRLILISSTVAENTASFRGTALFMIDSRGPILTNTLIAGSCSFHNTGPSTSNGGNIESPGTNCAMNHPTDRMGVPNPELGPLTWSGPTPTYPLLSGSPAIDSALDALCPETDQRGIARPQDGDDDGVARCDVGAYERTLTPVGSVEIPALDEAGKVLLVLLLGWFALSGLRRV